MSVRAMRIDAKDNVAVVVANVEEGGRVRLDDGDELTVRQGVPRGNKVALVRIPRASRCSATARR